MWVKLLRPWLRLYRGALVEDSRMPQCLLIYKSFTNNSISSPVSVNYTSVRTLMKKSPNTSEVNAVLDKQDNPKIQLFGLENELMAVLTKHQAKAQAEKRGLKLVEVDGTAKPYPVYQLMTGKDLHKQQMEQRQNKKGKLTEKSFRLATKISQHDLDIKLKQMEQNLMKGNRVKLIVNTTKFSSPQEGGEERSKMLKIVTGHLKEFAIVSKASDTGKDLMVVFKPLQSETTEESNDC
ncbi:translation initiation factor IF-3-like isoform X2 [Liolophura sinensis]